MVLYLLFRSSTERAALSIPLRCSRSMDDSTRLWKEVQCSTWCQYENDDHDQDWLFSKWHNATLLLVVVFKVAFVVVSFYKSFLVIWFPQSSALIKTKKQITKKPHPTPSWRTYEFFKQCQHQNLLPHCHQRPWSSTKELPASGSKLVKRNSTRASQPLLHTATTGPWNIMALIFPSTVDWIPIPIKSYTYWQTTAATMPQLALTWNYAKAWSTTSPATITFTHEKPMPFWNDACFGWQAKQKLTTIGMLNEEGSQPPECGRVKNNSNQNVQNWNKNAVDIISAMTIWKPNTKARAPAPLFPVKQEPGYEIMKYPLEQLSNWPDDLEKANVW